MHAGGSCEFDMGAYRQRYIAMEVFYLGWRYHGFASQANTDQTVEVSCACGSLSAHGHT